MMKFILPFVDEFSLALKTAINKRFYQLKTYMNLENLGKSLDNNPLRETQNEFSF